LINEERCKLYQRTVDERTKKLIFKNWLEFKAKHQRAKKYWYRIYLRLDQGLKHQAIKKWRQFS
jgi:hypothetical protein